MRVLQQSWPSLEHELKDNSPDQYRRAGQRADCLKSYWLKKTWLDRDLKEKIEKYVDSHEDVLDRCARDGINLHFILETLVYTVWDQAMVGAHSIIKSLSSPEWETIPKAVRKTALLLRRYVARAINVLPAVENGDTTPFVVPPDSEAVAGQLDVIVKFIESKRLTSRDVRKGILRAINLPYGAGRFNIRENSALLKLHTLFEQAGIKDCYARLEETVHGAFSRNPDDKSIPKRIKGLIKRDPEAYESAVNIWRAAFNKGRRL